MSMPISCLVTECLQYLTLFWAMALHEVTQRRTFGSRFYFGTPQACPVRLFIWQYVYVVAEA